MGDWFNRLDRLAYLARVGLPVRPVDPDQLPAPVRGVLDDWAGRHAEMLKEAQEAAKR